MKRLLIASTVTATNTLDGVSYTERKPDLSGMAVYGAVVVDELTAARLIVLVDLPDGTATTNTTLADISSGQDDFDFVQLTPARKTFIKNFLVNNGYPNAATLFDAENVTTTKELVRFIFRKLRNKDYILDRLSKVGLG